MPRLRWFWYLFLDMSDTYNRHTESQSERGFSLSKENLTFLKYIAKKSIKLPQRILLLFSQIWRAMKEVVKRFC